VFSLDFSYRELLSIEIAFQQQHPFATHWQTSVKPLQGHSIQLSTETTPLSSVTSLVARVRDT
jgi:hypothetical protein